MKRTALKRGRPPTRRTPMRRVSARQRARLDAWAAVTRAAILDHGGRCPVRDDGCSGDATVGHHILPKSQGGEDTRGNCLPVCTWFHSRIHNWPAWAYAAGFLRRRADRREP